MYTYTSLCSGPFPTAGVANAPPSLLPDVRTLTGRYQSCSPVSAFSFRKYALLPELCSSSHAV